MLLSDASCWFEVEARSKWKDQTELAAAMLTKEILINKQRKRQRSARENCTHSLANSLAKQSNGNVMQRGRQIEKGKKIDNL